ncbi:MAG: aminomethyl-transferring glycine dehydrogenase subunit GcvPA [Candidatus Aminicenantes bacterium]|nr:aminomethyl-transferring glycine dehydrogenase subunit GcvPA [Candidatus Aminicenantes bacterium]
MSFISLSDLDKKEMLARIGVSSPDDFFSGIPERIRMKKELRLPQPLSEPELVGHFGALGRKNKAGDYLSFLGAGAYRHYIPAIVDYLSSRGEFISPYTPYQPEVSQGTLQVVFEYQTLICQLTGMEIANASLYDGASAAAEAVLMAQRIRSRPKILVAGSLHPQYRKVIQTYVKNLPIRIEEISADARGKLDSEALSRAVDGQTSAVVCQSPNFFGVVEDLDRVAEIARERQALSVAIVAEAVSLGLLRPPGASGADIVAGEGQSLGLPVSFGGPYLGFMACRRDFLRQFPGRIAGETQDAEGKRGFVLTFSTREQHIRRERATSNICTNQAWCALRATIFLETLGRQGMRELACQNVQKAGYALERLGAIKGIRRRFSGPIFNEFVLEFEGGYAKIADYLLRNGVIGGQELGSDYPELGSCALFCVTEVHSKEDIDRLAGLIEEAVP